MSDDAIVPEEWVKAGARAAFGEVEPSRWHRQVAREVLEAVVPLAEQRVTRDLLKAREETEGR